jgi:hypothetical protein
MRRPAATARTLILRRKSVASPPTACGPSSSAWSGWRRSARRSPTIRAIIRIRKQEPADVEEQETLLDLYRRALGM